MISLVVVDDHPALRAGLRAVLNAQPGMACLGESDGRDESLWPLLERAAPDVVILDYHLPQSNGLALCHRLKRRVPTPGVILYSAYAAPPFVVPATIAGADALMDKGAGARDLFEVIRRVHGGERLLPGDAPAARFARLEQIPESERRVIARLGDGASAQEVAEALAMPLSRVLDITEGALERLQPETPAHTVTP